MKIPFSKITPHSKSYSYEKDGAKIECELSRLNRNQVSLKGEIKGEVSLDCDRCGTQFSQNVEWELELLLSNVVVKDTKDLDIIEFVNSDIDFEAILDGELNSYRLLYHYCKSCQDSSEELNLEF